jgi:hypothetical protein
MDLWAMPQNASSLDFDKLPPKIQACVSEILPDLAVGLFSTASKLFETPASGPASFAPEERSARAFRMMISAFQYANHLS